MAGVTTRSQAKQLTVGTLTRDQRKKLQKLSQHYELWYTLGVLNLLVSVIIAVRFPSYFWLYYSLKILYYLPYRLYRFQKKDWELYLLDWCYVVNYISDTCVVLAFLRTAFGIVTPLTKYNSLLIKAGFSMACGPLASSVYIFRNSIVFYAVDQNTSVFIHLAPFTLMWCLRFAAGYGPGYIQETFPDMFMVCNSNDDYTAADECMDTWSGALWCRACAAPLTSFVLPSAFIYVFVWAIPYFLFTFVWKREWIEENQKETLYTYVLDTNPDLEKFFQTQCCWFGDVYAGPCGYMICHFVWTMSMAGFSYLLWHSFLLYNVTFVFILVTAIHNGSTYMFRIFAYRFANEQLEKYKSMLE